MCRRMLGLLHPRLANWFSQTFGEPTDAQARCVPHILEGRSVLLSSPTGSGKTLAGFLGVMDHLIRLHEAGELRSGIHAVYVSPLRALTYDIGRRGDACSSMKLRMCSIATCHNVFRKSIKSTEVLSPPSYT